jgi:hypothetical protein
MSRTSLNFLLALIVILNYTIIFTQKEIATHQNGWISYLGNHKLSKKFGLHTEYQWRREDGFHHWQQSLLRVGIDYNLNSSFSISMGYGWIETFPYGEQPVIHEFTEHRIWQQFNQKNKVETTLKNFEIQHRYRLEQRFLETYSLNNVDGIIKGNTVFRQRVRYRLMFMIPLNKKSLEDNTLFLNVNDELFVGFGKGIAKNVFDQNRFNAALGWKFSPNFSLQVGYLNQYIIKADGIKAERNHTLLISTNYNLDYSKTKKP